MIESFKRNMLIYILSIRFEHEQDRLFFININKIYQFNRILICKIFIKIIISILKL
jgi:hypothetical protein